MDWSVLSAKFSERQAEAELSEAGCGVWGTGGVTVATACATAPPELGHRGRYAAKGVQAGSAGRLAVRLSESRVSRDGYRCRAYKL